MKISREILATTYAIQSFRPGEIHVTVPADPAAERPRGVAVMTTSFILMPDRIVDTWEPESVDELEPGHMETVAGMNPEVVLVGSGESLRFPSSAIMRSLIDRSIGVEVMDTAAACRTYNVLAGEGRAVAAALLLR